MQSWVWIATHQSIHLKDLYQAMLCVAPTDSMIVLEKLEAFSPSCRFPRGIEVSHTNKTLNIIALVNNITDNLCRAF